MPDPLPTHCALEHPSFRHAADAVFRRCAGDGLPAMVLPFGDREAVMPLHALRRALGLADESADGRMLALVAQALDFVGAIRLGDALPAEILTGEASWSPEASHRERAAVLVRDRLAALVSGAAPGGPHADAPRRQLQQAFDRAAQAAGLASREEAVTLVAALADELAYIEALRLQLLEPVRTLAQQLEAPPADPLQGGWRGDDRRAETLQQVRRLSRMASAGLSEQFADLERQTGDVVSAIRDIAPCRAMIRSARDSLYRRKRAWEPVLAEWSGDPYPQAAVWPRLDRLYRFLAPRYMPVMEWTRAAAQHAAKGPRLPAGAIVWQG